jgi:hypothetical protein
MSSLKSLMEVMPPPDRPSEPPKADGWQSVAASLGVELPEDYKEFITIYGTGAVDGFLWVLTPFTQNQNLNLLEQAKVRLDVQRKFSEASGMAAPYELNPNPNGLLPWGVTDNGDVLYWLCSGAPSTWAIVVCDSRASRWLDFRQTFGEFLNGVVTKKLNLDIFPDDFPSESPKFVTL